MPSTTSGSNPPPFFSKSASKEYIPLQRVAGGKDGVVFECYLRNELPIDGLPISSVRAKRVAVKVLNRLELPEDFQESSLATFAITELGLAEFLTVQLLRSNMQSPRPCMSLPRVYNMCLDKSDPNYTCWYSMEFIQGCPLAAIINEEMHIPAWLMSHIFIEVAAALMWLHEHHIYHSDLYDANIMVAPGTDYLRVVVIDFSCARTSVDEEVSNRKVWADCLALRVIMEKIVEQGMKGNDEDERKKTQLKDALKLALHAVTLGRIKGIGGIWEACRDMATRFREEGNGTLSQDIRDMMEEGALGDDKLVRLIQQDGMEVALVPWEGEKDEPRTE